jgi:hypothetical protein
VKQTLLNHLPFGQRGGLLPWLAGGMSLIVVAAVGGVIGYFIFLRLMLGLTLTDQPTAISLPPSLDVTAEVTNVVDIGLDGFIDARVPFNQQIFVPLRGRYDIDIKLDTQVPVAFEVIYEGVIPVDTTARIQARTNLNFQTIKQYRNLLIDAELPLKFDLPVKLRVPVNDTIRFKYEGPLPIVANQNLKTRLDTVLPTRLAVSQTTRTPISGRFGMRLNMPQKPIRAIINHAELDIDVSSLRLEIADDNSSPGRQENPFGPAARP